MRHVDDGARWQDQRVRPVACRLARAPQAEARAAVRAPAPHPASHGGWKTSKLSARLEVRVRELTSKLGRSERGSN